MGVKTICYLLFMFLLSNVFALTYNTGVNYLINDDVYIIPNGIIQNSGKF